MLERRRILSLLRDLDAELGRMGAVGEVGLCGGAVMCLVFEARRATKDIDAIFRPAADMRRAIKAVARRRGLPDDWLNDAAKGFFHAEPPREEVLDLPHLRVWAPRADYMLAMKCVAARFDTSDRDDVLFLIRRLKLKDADAVFKTIERYYPRKLIPAKTQFLVEELFEAR